MTHNSQEELKRRKHEIERAIGSIWKKVNGGVKQAELVFCDSAPSAQRQKESITQLTQTKASKASGWVYAAATASALGPRALPRGEGPSAGVRRSLCPVDRALTVHCALHRAEFLSPFHFLPSCATICAGSRTAEDMFFTLLIYGADSRRKLPRLSPSQPQIGEYRCS